MRMNFTKITLPTEEEKWIEFKNFKNKLDVPFIIYADIEAILEPSIENNEESPKGA